MREQEAQRQRKLHPSEDDLPLFEEASSRPSQRAQFVAPSVGDGDNEPERAGSFGDIVPIVDHDGDALGFDEGGSMEFEVNECAS